MENRENKPGILVIESSSFYSNNLEKTKINNFFYAKYARLNV